jgi:hypothetical protein
LPMAILIQTCSWPRAIHSQSPPSRPPSSVSLHTAAAPCVRTARSMRLAGSSWRPYSSQFREGRGPGMTAEAISGMRTRPDAPFMKHTNASRVCTDPTVNAL